MAMVYYKKKPGKRELTAEEIQMLEDAAKMPPNYDDDCPELTEEMLRGLIEARKRKPLKPVQVTLTVSPLTVAEAQVWDEDYLGFLGRVLDEAMAGYLETEDMKDNGQTQNADA